MTGNAEASGRRRLLVAKATFEAMRGAERDLIRNLPALAQEFDITVATLQPSKELDRVVARCVKTSGCNQRSNDLIGRREILAELLQVVSRRST